MKTQFIVAVAGKDERKLFYEYIVNTYNLDKYYPFFKRQFIQSNFPFVIDFKENIFWICNSITCCACASQAKVIYTVDQFKVMTKNDYDKYKRKKI